MESWSNGAVGNCINHKLFTRLIPFICQIYSSSNLAHHSKTSSLHSARWQGGRDSNPQPTVLETATLPIELPP